MKHLDTINTVENQKPSVKTLLQAPAKLKPLTGDTGLKQLLSEKNIYRPQLALTGYYGSFNHTQVQIFGNTEYFYMKSLKPAESKKRFKQLCEFDLPCIILTNNHTLDKVYLDIAAKSNIAVLNTPFNTTKASYLISEFLDDQFANQGVIHGSFVDVYGVGILFVGNSGIGKSEIALDLVERGHRLVADDVVMLTKKRETILMGTGTSMIQHFMEIRGLGIIDIRQMFGIRSIRFQKRLEIIVELEEWDESAHYTRTGLDEEPIDVMGVEMQNVKLPIFPGKNITVIAEVIAINYLLRTYGYNAAKVLSKKLLDSMKSGKGGEPPFASKRIIPHFQGDRE